jgi:tetratricopeptide (TPR) repeat protein
MSEEEAEEIVLRYNKLAMECLQGNNFRESLVLLQKAESVLELELPMPNRLSLISTTYNNLGCHYKKKGLFQKALSYLRSALEIEEQIDPSPLNIANCFLNISAVFSSMKKHEQAFNYSRQALSVLEQENEPSFQLAKSLSVSYFNCGVELEYLFKPEEAARYYFLGFEIANSELGENDPLTHTFKEVLNKIIVQKRTLKGINSSTNRETRNKLPYISNFRIGEKRIHRVKKKRLINSFVL